MIPMLIQYRVQIIRSPFQCEFPSLEFNLLKKLVLEAQVLPLAKVCNLVLVVRHAEDITWLNITMGYVVVMEVGKPQNAIPK